MTSSEAQWREQLQAEVRAHTATARERDELRDQLGARVGETIGARLKRERTIRSVSQRDLATQVGVGVPHISKVENGQESPSDVLLTRIAETFGLDADELILIAGRVPTQYLDAMQADPDRSLRYLRHLRQRFEIRVSMEDSHG